MSSFANAAAKKAAEQDAQRELYCSIGIYICYLFQYGLIKLVDIPNQEARGLVLNLTVRLVEVMLVEETGVISLEVTAAVDLFV